MHRGETTIINRIIPSSGSGGRGGGGSSSSDSSSNLLAIGFSVLLLLSLSLVAVVGAVVTLGVVVGGTVSSFLISLIDKLSAFGGEVDRGELLLLLLLLLLAESEDDLKMDFFSSGFLAVPVVDLAGDVSFEK